MPRLLTSLFILLIFTSVLSDSLFLEKDKRAAPLRALALSVTLSSNTIDEGAAGTVGTFTVTGGTGAITYTLVNDYDSGSFAVSSGGILSTSAALDYEVKSAYRINVKFDDTASNTLTQEFTINLNDVDDPTDISFDSLAVDENTTGAVGQASSVGGGAFKQYTLQPGGGSTHNSDFAISTSGALTITAAADYETRNAYSIRVRVTDTITTLYYEEVFIVTVNDLPDPNDITFDSLEVNENAANAAVGSATTLGGNVGDTYTYTLESGTGDTDNASFQFTGAQLEIINAADFEVKNSYTIRVQTQDQNSRLYQKAFTVTILDLDDPNSVTLDNSSVSENAAGVLVGQASTSGGTGPYTYAKAAGNGDTDNGDFTITSSGALTLDNAGDYETKKYFSIRIQTTDTSTSLTYEQILIIDITDVSEPSDLLMSRANLNQNTANAAVGTVRSIGGFSPFSYTLVAGTGDTDNASFALDAATGALSLVGLAVKSTKATYDVRIQVSDNNSNTFAKAFTLTVLEYVAIAGISVDSTRVMQNEANTVVGWLSTTGGNTPYVYTLVTGDGDTDNAEFTIIGNNLILTNAADYETKTSYSLRVRSTDDYGSFKETSFTIEVIDLNDVTDDDLSTMMIIMISLSSVLFFLLILTVCICSAKTKQLSTLQDTARLQDESSFMQRPDNPPTDHSFSRTDDSRSGGLSSKVRPLQRMKR